LRLPSQGIAMTSIAISGGFQ